MIHPLKVTSTLADETRYQIYEYMLQEKKPFTVQDIADKFNIHPNVARLHLTKLSEINVITADFVKSGKGGRPGRVYKASEQGVVLSFPKRDESLLLKWSIQLIEKLGVNALETAKQISYQDGFEQINKQLHTEHKIKQTIGFDEKLNILTQSAAMIGYIPQLEETETGTKIIFTIYNCPFNNQLSTNNNIVCAIHESYLKGQVDALFSQNEFLQFENMVNDCDFCKYSINVPNKAKI
ncbi:predicted ArsR family transcriptional regulator [Ureibacillus xyleni]|uniref:Predicted ArsR family transcriptional regulator n=1 Tax=Ureibacillus xyleni TaxID=614648 RepID=A0A285TV01_9BACL|nr:helix-turn-helix domain-containing protein [Ureibacillus xyleni]SOC27352.1 predicted ArsR family transcriptional regulator [Ureibacillus xyleni]